MTFLSCHNTYSSAAWGARFCWRWVLIFCAGGMWGRVVCQECMATKLHSVTSSNTIFLIIITLSEIFMNIFLLNTFCYQHTSLHFPALSEWVVHPAIMHRWVAVGININPELECETLDCIVATQDRDNSRAVVNKVMNLRLWQKAGNFLTRSGNISFWRWAQLLELSS